MVYCVVHRYRWENCAFSFLSSIVKLKIIGVVFCGLKGRECFTKKAVGFTRVLSFNSFGIVKKRVGLLMNFKLSWNLTLFTGRFHAKSFQSFVGYFFAIVGLLQHAFFALNCS